MERGGTPNSTSESNLNRLRKRVDNENTWNLFIFQRQTCMLRQKKERTNKGWWWGGGGGMERGGTPNSTSESNLNRLRKRVDNENTWNLFIFQRQTCMLRQKKERTNKGWWGVGVGMER